MRRTTLLMICAIYGGLFVDSNHAAAETLKITAFGDSLTHGYGLPLNDGFVPQMQRSLQNAGYDVEIVNAGVSGDTSAGGAARIDWTLADNPDAIMIALGGNDLLRGLPPTETRANIETILESVKQAGIPVMLVGLTAPSNFGDDYQQSFNAIWPELALEYDALHMESFFQGLLAEEESIGSAQHYFQDDGIHPNAEGVTKIVAGFQPYFVELIERTE